MADVFGIFASALSVAALFNNCVDCFEYIQLGRHFERDYQRCQLRLDIAKTRLGRWGEAVSVNEDPRFATNSPGEQPVQLAQLIMEEIVGLFRAAHRKSQLYEKTAKPQELVLYATDDLAPVFRRLHGRLKDLAHRRQKKTSLVRKAAWALYDRREFEKTIDRITSFIDDLEKLFPVEGTYRWLAEMEIEEVEDGPSLAALNEAAQDTDKALLDATVKKLQMTATRNFAEEIKATNSADVQVGNQYSEVVLLRCMAITEQTSNSVGTVDARDTASVQIGKSVRRAFLEICGIGRYSAGICGR